MAVKIRLYTLTNYISVTVGDFKNYNLKDIVWIDDWTMERQAGKRLGKQSRRDWRRNEDGGRYLFLLAYLFYK